MTIRLHLDEHVSPAIATGLRLRGIDVTVTLEVGLSGATDEAQCAFALRESRVIVTHDSDYLSCSERGIAHAGVAYCHQGKYSIGQLIQLLVILHGCFTAEELVGRVEYL